MSLTKRRRNQGYAEAGEPNPNYRPAPNRWESEEQYRVRVHENDRLIGDDLLHDPFIRTRIHPRGLKAALLVLFGRLKLEVWADGSKDSHKRVFAPPEGNG